MGALAGVGSGAGGAFLYRGLAAGRMGVVAPISAVGAALLRPALRATGQVPDDAGFAPLAVTQGVAVVAVLATSVALGGRWLVAAA